MKMIGIGDNGQESLLPQYAQWIEESEVLVGGERCYLSFPNYQGEKIVIKGGLQRLWNNYRRKHVHRRFSFW